LILNAKKLLLICAATSNWAFSFGLGTQVVSHWLHARGQSDAVIGLNHACYYLGVTLGSCAVPWLNRRLGSLGCVWLGMSFTGCTLAIFPWCEEIGFWYLLRFLNGWASAMSLVPLETIVSRDSLPENKTQNFGFYGLSLTVGGALGTGLGLHFYAPEGGLAFFLGGAVPIVGSLLLWVGLRREPRQMDVQESSHPLGWGRNFLSYGTAWCQGFLEGGMLAFLSLFLLARGFVADEAGLLLCFSMLGVILFQVPVSWLADRIGRVRTLLGCYVMIAVSLVAIPSLSQAVPLAIVLFLLGASTGAMFPLGLAMLGDRTPAQGLARAYAWYMAADSIGCVAGAAAMGGARDRWGDTAMFLVGLAAVVLVLGANGLIRFALAQRHTNARRTNPFSPHATPLTTHQN
jgi:MFS family permease